MREILFRGKSVISDHWIYGMFCDEDYDSSVPCIVPHDSCYVELSEWEVDRNTVGQYTGLKDKNGVMIFEGDIVSASNGHKSYVVFCYGKFLLYCECHRKYTELWADNATIIGNIYDNQELLEVLND